MPRVRGESNTNPSPDMLRRGREFGAWFRSSLQLSGLNVNQLAKSINAGSSQLYIFRNDCLTSDGDFKKPSKEMIRDIADATRTNARDGIAAMYDMSEQPNVPQDIMDLNGDARNALSRFIQALTPSDFITVKILGSVGASGSGADNGDTLEESVSVLRSMLPDSIDVNEDVFAVRVKGDCLGGLAIIDKDLIICRRSQTAESGAIVAVCEDGSDNAYVKQYCAEDGATWLETRPLNGPIERVEVDGARIIGVKIGLYRKG